MMGRRRLTFIVSRNAPWLEESSMEDDPLLCKGFNKARADRKKYGSSGIARWFSYYSLSHIKPVKDVHSGVRSSRAIAVMRPGDKYNLVIKY